MKYLFACLKKYTKESILAPLFKMLEALFDLFVPLVVASMIDQGINLKDSGHVIRCVILLVIMAVIGLACSFVAQYFAAKAATGVSTRMRRDLFTHIQGLGSSEADKIGPSTLITRMTSDINQVQNGVNLFLRLFLRSPFIVFGAMIMAFTIDSGIAMIFVAVIPILSVIVFGVMKWTSPQYKKIQGKLDRLTQITRENLTGVRVVRAFGREDSEERSFNDANSTLVDHQIRVGKISALMNPLTYIVVNLGVVAILAFGANAVNDGVLLSGSIVALVNYMNQILVELVKLANLIVTVSRAGASLDRVNRVMETPSSMVFPEKTGIIPQTDEAVRFDHVSIRYQGAGSESLTDVSFCAKKGQVIGIIGGTGSGKSSVVNLIPRFYDATSGTVSLMGLPVCDWAKGDLHSCVGIVPQKAQLFSGTIRSNLLYGDASASDEDLWNALRLAQAEDFVKAKPCQLDEKVEQGGRNLSGGQRQRMTIARALVRKPKILILDDSASALDFATDAALRASLRTLTDTTVFIVSQRTSSLRHADQILVLDDGALVGLGTHDELMASCDVYREIHESQFRKEDAKQ